MKIARPNFLLLGFLLLFLFAILTFLVQKNVFVHLDFNTTVRLQDKIPDRVIGLFSLFSLLGTVEFASVAILISLFFLKKMNKLFILFLYSLTGAFELLGKAFISQKGPPLAFLKTQQFLSVPSDYIPRDFFSYPSGHSARTAFVSGVLIWIVWNHKKINKETRILIVSAVLFFDFLMFISRIYLGEHWLSDVVGGVLLGFSLAIIACNTPLKHARS